MMTRQSARFDDSAYNRHGALLSACKTAIHHGNHLSDIKPDRWATTYRCTTEDVRSSWEAALTELSRAPRNCEIPEGK